MVGRKVEDKHHLFRPVQGGWEHWQNKLLRGTGTLEELIRGKDDHCADTYLALSARCVIAAPLWLPRTDLSTAREMAQVELDIRGLIPKQGDSVLTVRVIGTVQERMLVCAQVFPFPFPDKFSHPAFSFFNASPLFVSLEEDTLHLWREGADIVAVFTRGEKPIYWETIPFLTSHLELLAWLECMGLLLREQGFLAPEMGFISFLDFDLPAPSFRTVATELSMPPLREELPLCEWKSPPRRTVEKAQKRKEAVVKIISVTGGVYLLFIIAFLGWVGVQHWEASRLRQKISAIEPEIRKLQEVRRQWNILASTIEATGFPIEILHFIVKQMPSEGMWLTQFEFDNQKLGISGEAENVSTAAQFFTNVGQELPHIQWDMPPPALLSNNKARFAIAGVITNETD